MADPKSDFEAPKDPAQLLPWLEAKREAGRTRLPVRQMKLNLAYFLGEQWLVWDTDRRTFAKPRTNTNDPNAPIRITANKMGALIERYIARLLKPEWAPEARPVSDDDHDVDSAKVGTRMMASELHRLDWDAMKEDLYYWVLPLGWSYAQVAWDPSAGSLVGQDNGGKPVHEGNITLDLVPAFELGVDPNSRRRDLSDANWATRTVSMTEEGIWERWGVKITGAEKVRSLGEEVYDLLDNENEKPRAHTVSVHQLWLRPSRANPAGLVVTWAGATILEAPKPFPYEHGQLPFVEFDLLPGLGTREGRTFVKDMVPLQADYNDARSREAGVRRTLVPKIVAPTGSIDPNRVTTRVEVITYNPVGAKPDLMLPDGRWMSQYEQSMARADAEMGDRVGETDAQFGTRTPAASILAIQDMTDTNLATPTRLLKSGTARLGWMILALIRQYWTSERVVNTWSEDGDLAIMHFSGAEIDTQLDVRIAAESGLPRSKAARVQLAMDLMALPEISAHIDPRQFFRLIDLPGTDFIVASMNLDVKQAERENGRLMRGETVEVRAWENHAAHYKVHNDLRKSEDYEKLPPPGQAIIDAHADLHLTMLQAQATAQAMGAVPHPGSPPIQSGGAPPAQPGQPGQPGGQSPESQINERAGIGGPGQPGSVPGTSADTQAASMGQ